MSDTVWRSDAQSTVTDLLDRRLASDADGPYLDVMGSTFTAAEIERTGNAIANGLAGLGVGTGDEAHEVEGFGAMASPTSQGAGRRGITVQGFNLFDTFPIHVVAPGSKPGSGVVDHKSED